MPDKEKSNQSVYGSVWDEYVKERFPAIKAATPFAQRELAPWRVLNTKDNEYIWPGDEWGDRETARRLFNESFGSRLGDDVKFLCELGAGAGRYTVLALERFSHSTILSFDVSAEFEAILKKRCSPFVEAGRLKTYLLDEDPLRLVNTVLKKGLFGKIDGVYSFDAMVHVDLHTLLVYWISAARMLKPGGILAMNVADASSENGFMKLLNDSVGIYRQVGNAGGHFMWASEDIAVKTLGRLGFEVTITEGNGRDVSFSAKLVDADRSARWLKKARVTWFDYLFD